MADTGTRLIDFLNANAAVAAIAEGRVYQDHIPQEIIKRNPVPPLVCFQQSGSIPERCFDDPVGTAPFRFTFNLDSVSENSTTAKALRDAVHGCLDTYHGPFVDSTVKGILCSEQNDDYEPFAVSSDSGLHVESQQVEVVP